mgnify:CR=1 FL=1
MMDLVVGFLKVQGSELVCAFAYYFCDFLVFMIGAWINKLMFLC